MQASFFPLSFFLFFCTPTIVINGVAHKGGWWSSQFFPLAPGNYNVKIFFKYLTMNECGANAIDVSVAPGQVSHLKYFMPPLVTAKGSLTIA